MSKPDEIEDDRIFCAGKKCMELVKEEGELCPSCEADRAEAYAQAREEEALEDAKDRYWMQKIDERRGK